MRSFFINIVAIFLLLFVSCINNQGLDEKRKRGEKNKQNNLPASTPTKKGSGNNAAPGENGGGQIGNLDDLIENGRAELRHLIDPFDGTYKTKLTLPKNFTGLLYLSGLNITSLNSKIVYVRFHFGRELEPITIQATIGRAPGIIPQTEIEVIILDVRGKPFEKIRLLYDLFDYSDYRDNSGVQFGKDLDSDQKLELTTDPRSGDLYCRGLRVENDPSFVPTLDKPECNYSGARCLYAYAKVKDSGLYDLLDQAISPSNPQIDLSGTGYSSDTQAHQLTKCLPDTSTRDVLKSVLGLTDDSSFGGSGYGINVTMLDSTIYKYNGPYRVLATEDWEITGNAVFGKVSSTVDPAALYESSWNNATGDLSKDYVGYKSFLFPRAEKMSINGEIEHFSSENPFDDKSKTSLIGGGDTNYMDGCNTRVSKYDEFSNESISSCNVTAKIEIVHIDQASDEETILASSIDVKLQLIMSSNTNYMGTEVLYTSMKTCTNSRVCGANECCYNGRCWEKTLVGRCLEDVEATGNLGIGATCSSDYECSSLCCSQSTGKCSVHINNSVEQVLCGKVAGQSCVSKEWCKKDYITNCYIVKTGTDELGNQDCGVRCYQIPTFSDCIDGVCRPPSVPPLPEFDEEDEKKCENAVDPPDID